MNRAQLKEIRQLAEAATPGPWRSWQGAMDISEVQCGEKTPIAKWTGFDDSDRKAKQHRNNADYIAAMSPDVTLRLLAHIEEQDKLIEQMADLFHLAAHPKFESGCGLCARFSVKDIAEAYRQWKEQRNA